MKYKIGDVVRINDKSWRREYVGERGTIERAAPNTRCGGHEEYFVRLGDRLRWFCLEELD